MLHRSVDERVHTIIQALISWSPETAPSPSQSQGPSSQSLYHYPVTATHSKDSRCLILSFQRNLMHYFSDCSAFNTPSSYLVQPVSASLVKICNLIYSQSAQLRTSSGCRSICFCQRLSHSLHPSVSFSSKSSSIVG